MFILSFELIKHGGPELSAVSVGGEAVLLIPSEGIAAKLRQQFGRPPGLLICCRNEGTAGILWMVYFISRGGIKTKTQQNILYFLIYIEGVKM
jgi:hypothetical protein